MKSYSQELLQAVLYAPLVDGEESSSDLVDGFGQAVDVVAVACRGQQTHVVREGKMKTSAVIEHPLNSDLISDMRGSGSPSELRGTCQYKSWNHQSGGGRHEFSVLYLQWLPLRVACETHKKHMNMNATLVI